MIGCREIQKAVAELLNRFGFSAVARESAEGGKKPMCGVDVFPTYISRTNGYMADYVFEVEITYYPAFETQEELVTTADRLSAALLDYPLEIENRTLSCHEVEFDRNGTNLIVSTEYALTQFCGAGEDDNIPSEYLELNIAKE